MRLLKTLVVLLLLPVPAWAQPAYPMATPTSGASTGTVTAGGTFQQAASASQQRLSIDFQNRAGNGDACYLYFGTTAAANAAGTGKAIKVADGQEYLRSSGSIPSDAVQVTCATTGDAFYLATQ